MAVPSSPVPASPSPSIEPQPVPPASPQPQKVSITTIVLSVLLVILISTALVIVIFFDQIMTQPFTQKLLTSIPQLIGQQVVLPTTPPTPTAKPTPSYLPNGKSTYQITQTLDSLIPKIESITLDPTNIKIDQEQTIMVDIRSQTPVRSAHIVLYADDKQKQNIELTQESTQGDKSVWKATWNIQYTTWYRYVYMITAVNDVGENNVYVALRTVGPILKADLE